VASPTAIQAVGVAHDTPLRLLEVTPGSEFALIDQVTPFQVSTRESVAEAVAYDPTATHQVLLAQDTAERPVSAPSASAGTGLRLTDQTRPFHDSTRGSESGPTA